MRVAVGLSGGADSVALVCALAARREELGLVLHAAHLHHGLRGAEADGDLEFARGLAAGLGLPFHEERVDVAEEAREDRALSKAAESIEEAARRVRYSWFQKLLSEVPLDAIATAHTLDDQAETVLAKFLRGAWTEGLAGIAAKLEFAEGAIVRPVLGATRGEVERFLYELGQNWREDSSNRDVGFTRNRIRHELLPVLEGWNPRLREHLAQMAALAQDEEAWWQDEMARLAPQLLMQGRPVRGGGRAAGVVEAPCVAVEAARFAALPAAVQRRLLRYAAAQLGAAPDFPATEALRRTALSGRAGQRLELTQGLRAERSHRELRLTLGADSEAGVGAAEPTPEYEGTVPGAIDGPAFGVFLRLELRPEARGKDAGGRGSGMPRTAILRNWRPGDRVRLRYSAGLRKVKEVLDRLRVTGSGRRLWPVLELEGRIVWMRGAEVEPEPGLVIEARFASEHRHAGEEASRCKAEIGKD